MKVVIQRVKESSVIIEKKEYSSIKKGLLILVGFTYSDDVEKIKKITDKIINLRIFEDENNKMNLNIKDINGEIMTVSQFTLYADTKKGNRPSFKEALDYETARNLYDEFNIELGKKIKNIKTGIFGSDMEVKLINDGPVTIIIEE